MILSDRKQVKKAVSLVLILIVFSTALYLGLYYHAVSSASMKEAAITSVSDIGLSGVTLEGEVELLNQGYVAVTLDRIEYEIISDTSGNELAGGIIQGSTIPAGESAEFPFSARVTLGSSAASAWKLLVSGEMVVWVRGKAYIDGPWILDQNIEFNKSMDLGNMVR
ncbi:hypothetical protein GF351_01730 [Candidatus Woesearchaeota archaeon]|nr:hypothetical protein [Candidatus Woesearchaeota archaeon]